MATGPLPLPIDHRDTGAASQSGAGRVTWPAAAHSAAAQRPLADGAEAAAPGPGPGAARGPARPRPRSSRQQPRQVLAEAQHLRLRQQGLADGAQSLGLGDVPVERRRRQRQVARQLAQRHVQGRARLGAEEGPARPQQHPQPPPGPGPGPRRALRRVAPRREHVVGQAGVLQVLRRPAHVPGQRLQPGGTRRVEEEGGRRDAGEEAEAARRAERAGGRRLHQQRPVQVEAVEVQVVHGGAGPAAVEAQAEARVGAEERGLQPPAQRRRREGLRQPPRRLRQQQDVAPLQRAGVDGHQEPVAVPACPAQAEQHLAGGNAGEVEGPGVEGLPEAADSLRGAALGAALDVELGHQPHGAGQDAGGQRPQPVPEQAPLHPVAPARQQRPVEAGRRGARLPPPAGSLQDEILLPVGELLGARVARLLARRRHAAGPGARGGHSRGDRPVPPGVSRHPAGRARPGAGRCRGSGRVTLEAEAAGAAMGGSSSLLPREALSEYQELTFLSKQEILLAYKRFSELLPKEERENACSARLPESRILTLPELRANPFQHQICRVFSTSDEGDGSMSFEDFLDMLSVFSDTATLDIKSHYAFRIFDFDGDGALDRKDLEKLVNCLTGHGEESRLSTAEMEQLIENILEESDIDKDGTINLSEFQHIVSRSPDFTSSFKIVL